MKGVVAVTDGRAYYYDAEGHCWVWFTRTSPSTIEVEGETETGLEIIDQLHLTSAGIAEGDFVSICSDYLREQLAWADAHAQAN